MSVKASISRAIAIERHTLPEEVESLLKASLTIPNPAREDAEREQTWGWEEIPKELVLFAEDDKTLYIPRGFASNLKRGLKSFGLKIEYDDQTVSYPGHHSDWKEPDPRKGQIEAIERLLKYKQGIIEAPPGWGKTVMLLLAIKRSTERALVIVDKRQYMEQWRDRARTHFGADCGVVGAGEWDEKPLTIAMQQTLWSRRDELKAEGWFQKWGLVCLDECHHASANTYTRILNQFPARYRWGLSATPDRDDGLARIVQVVIGDVLFKPGKEALRKEGQLVKPIVYRVPTNFQFGYHPTKKIGGKLIRNNYTKMMKHLVDDQMRNHLIMKHLVRGRAHLVVSDRLAHHDNIRKFAEKGWGAYGAPACDGPCWPADRLLMLTGREDQDQRDEAVRKAEEGDCVVFSTIAKEALDIPRLDTLHMVWPMRKHPMLTQVIGRIERGHPDKKDAIVMDYFDPRVSVLRGQSRDRAKYYHEEGLEVASLY